MMKNRRWRSKRLASIYYLYTLIYVSSSMPLHAPHREVSDLKAQVEQANTISAQCDEKLAVIDSSINRIFTVIPNLLDDR